MLAGISKVRLAIQSSGASANAVLNSVLENINGQGMKVSWLPDSADKGDVEVLNCKSTR